MDLLILKTSLKRQQKTRNKINKRLSLKHLILA